MANDWQHYTQVFLTEDEEQIVNERGSVDTLSRDGKPVCLLAQTDQDATYGVPARNGELLVSSCYAHQRGDFHEAIETVLRRHGGWWITDSYVSSIVLDLSGADDKAAVTRAIYRIDRKALAAYHERRQTVTA